MDKLVVLGIDSLSFNLINRFSEHLPAFKKIMEGGFCTKLKSVLPPITPCAWTCMFTGNNPGKNNISDFFVIEKDYSKKLINSTSKKTKSLWDLINKKCIVIDVPFTYPIHKINGIFVAGKGTPSFDSDFVYPKSFKETLKKFEYDAKDIIGRDNIIFFKEVLEDNKKKEKLFLSVLDYDYDLFIFIFQSIDHFHHAVWKFLDPNHPQYEKNEEIENKILEIYMHLDSVMDKLIKNNINFIVISDHGHVPSYKNTYINSFLRDKGLLAIKKVKGRKIFSQENLIKLDFLNLRKKIPHFLYKRLSRIPSSEDIESTIDWQNTKCWLSSCSGFININTIKKFDNGIVKEADVIKLKQKTIKLLNENKDRLGISEACTVESLYNGPCTKKSGEIFVTPKGTYSFSTILNKEWISINKSGVSGNHDLYGVFIAYGNKMRKGKIKEIDITDILPTILYYFDNPLPKYLDGKIVKDVFKFKRDVKYIDYDELEGVIEEIEL